MLIAVQLDFTIY